MLINMWGTGELKREFKVKDTTIYMKITRPLEPSAVPACILLNNAYVYYPQTNDEFWQYVPVYTALVVEHLRLPNDMSSLKRFVDYVQDGFDELFKTFPEEKDRDKQAFGEIDVKHGDVKFTKVLER